MLPPPIIGINEAKVSQNKADVAHQLTIGLSCADAVSGNQIEPGAGITHSHQGDHQPRGRTTVLRCLSALTRKLAELVMGFPPKGSLLPRLEGLEQAHCPALPARSRLSITLSSKPQRLRLSGHCRSADRSRFIPCHLSEFISPHRGGNSLMDKKNQRSAIELEASGPFRTLSAT